MNQNLNKLTNKPLRIIISFIVITLLLTFIGPVKYYNYLYWPMLFFMFFVILAIIFGYLSSSSIYNKDQNRLCSKSDNYFYNENVKNLIVIISMYVALIFELLTFISYISTTNDFSFYTLLYRVQSVGDIYRSSLVAAKEVNEVNRIRQFITFFGLLKQIAYVGFLLRKDKLKKYKVLFWAIVVLNLVNVLAFKGTQKEIGDLIIYFLSVWLIRKAMTGEIKLHRIIVPLVVIIVGIFGFMQLSRASSYNVDLSNFQNDFFKFDSNHIIYRLFGDTIGYAVASVIYYVSGGYYGLTKSLMVPFKWTYGLGNSFALSSYASQYLGIENMIIYSIPSRAELITGYPALMFWSTMFPWIASDFTFPGSVVLMFFIARLYARTWRESIYNDNLLSALLFTRLNIMWVFLPSNNQLMQTRESAIATILLVLLWFLYHNKFSNKVSIKNN